jgi:hypothetical protein
MPDAIDLLIRAYKNKIESLNLGFNVWTKLAPDTENGNCYIQIGVINGNTEGGKWATIEQYDITVSIFSRSTEVDPDLLAGMIKDAIFDDKKRTLINILPLKTFITGVRHVSPEALQFPDAIFTNRYLTFTHKVTH